MKVQQVGPYKILGPLGSGAHGDVLRAKGPDGREVAVKLIRGGRGAPPKVRKRFEREVAALARLKHPNIVSLIAAGEHEGHPYLVMPLLSGVSLQSQIDAGELDPRWAAWVVGRLADALKHAHAVGLLHRDLKPENVLQVQDGVRPVLTDFGLAKDLDGDQYTQLSHRGSSMGTPRYWPPEQASGDIDDVGPHSDIYGLGAILYAMLTGKAPVDGRTMNEILIGTREQEPTPPRELRADVDESLERITLRCLEKSPADRYPSAEALAEDLRRYLAGEPLARVRAQTRRETRRETRRDSHSQRLRARRKAPRLSAGVLVAGGVLVLSPFVAWGIVNWRQGVAAEEARTQSSHLLEKGDLDGALAAFDKLIELEPSADAYRRRGEARDKKGDAQGAIADMSQALSLEPNSPQHYAARARLRFRVGDLDGAIADAGDILRLDPTNSETLLLRGRAYAARGLFSEATADFDQAIQIHPGYAEAYFCRGQAAAAQGRHRSAIDDFSSAINLDDNLVEAVLARGVARSANRNYASAIRDFNRAIKILDDPAPALAGRGMAHRHSGRPGLAIADLERALRGDPKLPGVARELAFARFHQGDHRRAVADFDRALEADGSNVELWTARGAAKFEIGDTRGAASDYTKALELAPRSADVLAHRAALRKALGDWTGALADLDAAIDVDRHDPTYWSERGAIKLERNDLVGAILDASEAVRLHPSAEAYSMRGRALYGKGVMEEAAADFTSAMTLSPKQDPELHAFRALANKALGKTNQAAADAKLALRLAPGHEMAPSLRLIVAEEDEQALGGSPRTLTATPSGGRIRSPSAALPHGTRATSPHVKEDHNDPRFREALRKRGAGDLEGAVDDITALVAADPKHFYYNIRGYCEMQLRRHGAAISSFKQGHQLAPECGCSMGFAGDCHKFLGDLKSALEAYDVAIAKKAPDLDRVLCNRGQTREQLGEFKGALEDYSAAIKLQPNGGLAYYNRGGVLRKLGKLDHALRDLNSAIRLMPNYADAFLQRGMTRGDQGDMKIACLDFEQSLRLDPQQPKGATLRALIKKILGRPSSY